MIIRVDDVASKAGFSRRQLERLFRTYVGVSPKCVIQRYRLFEAADRLAEQPDANLAALAIELGYFDQAHFIRDFKAMIGSSPAHTRAGLVHHDTLSDAQRRRYSAASSPAA
jgi:transcriptional regulator GlxA family with amidase domain